MLLGEAQGLLESKSSASWTSRAYGWMPNHRWIQSISLAKTTSATEALADIEAGTRKIAAKLTGAAAAVTTQPPPETTWRVCTCLPALAYRQRLVGAGFCFSAGLVMLLSSLASLTSLLLGNPVPFAVKFALGNLLSVGASTFVVGPSRQLRSMFAPERRAASAAYLSLLAATLFCALQLQSHLFTACALVLQLMAMAWYILSYIPFGQSSLRWCIRRCLGRS